jgi:hypothetical protein
VLRVPELEIGFHLLYELKPTEARAQFEAWQKCAVSARYPVAYSGLSTWEAGILSAILAPENHCCRSGNEHRSKESRCDSFFTIR